MAKAKLTCTCSTTRPAPTSLYLPSDRMRCRAPTATVASMPMSASAPLVKLPLLPRGLVSYIPTNLSSILPRGRDAAPANAASPEPPPAQATSPKKMSSGQQAGRGSSKAADPAELARLFELFDRNGDGRITREELEDSLGKLGIPVAGDELAVMISRIDANGDGCVDVEEFGELYRAIMVGGKDGEGSGEEEVEDEDMREAFRVFDANADGYITVDELGAVLSSLGLKQGCTAEECRRMICQVDSDGDGRVDFREFVQMMRGGGFAALG